MRAAAVAGGALSVLVGVALVTGILPASAAIAAWQQAWPVLLFVAAMAVVASLADAAGVFDAVAEIVTSWGCGRAWLLWIWVSVAALVCTVFLSLDTTAVLLTPAVVATVRRVRLDVVPFALATVWIANTGSLLLPVSNLTNLLAQSAAQSSSAAFAGMMAAPAAAAAVVPLGLVAVVCHRRLAARYVREPVQARHVDPVLFRWAAVVLVVLIPLLVSGLPVWVPACAAAVVLILAFAGRRHWALRSGVLPWQVLLFAGGLMLAAALFDHSGAAQVMTVLGDGESPTSLLALSAAGAVSANVFNNLPAYLILQHAAGTPVRIAALLIGVNAGALLTPWASLATVLWHRQLAAAGIRIAWGRLMLLGCVAAPLTVAAAVLLL